MFPTGSILLPLFRGPRFVQTVSTDKNELYPFRVSCGEAGVSHVSFEGWTNRAVSLVLFYLSIKDGNGEGRQLRRGTATAVKTTRAAQRQLVLML